MGGMQFYNDTKIELPPHGRAPHLLRDPDPNASTIKGCKCASACGATADDGFTCDWCKTQDKCGSWSLPYLTYYDYCTYPVEEAYEANTWQNKFANLKAQVGADASTDGYPNVAKIFAEDVQTSFDC